MPTKIETSLTSGELLEFFRRCAQTKGGTTGPAIQALAQEFGVQISHESANTFRKGALKGYIEELKAKSERAQQVAAFAREGLSMSDAASVRLAETVFDDLMKPTAASLTAEERDTYSKIIARARLGDQRAQKLEADLKLRDEQLAALKQRMIMQQFDASAAVLKHAKEIKLVVADTKLDAKAKTERVRKILFGEVPADFKPITTKGASEA